MNEQTKARVRRVAKHRAAGQAKEFEQELTEIIETSVRNVSGRIKEILKERFPEKVSD